MTHYHIVFYYIVEYPYIPPYLYFFTIDWMSPTFHETNRSTASRITA